MTVPELRSALSARILSLCREVLPHGERENGYWRVGSLQDDSGRSLSVQLSGDYAGCWHDFSTSERGGVIKLIQATLNLKYPEAVLWAHQWLNEPIREPEPILERREFDVSGYLGRCVSTRGTSVEKYLKSRGIQGDVPADLRYRSCVRHTPSGSYQPAMIAVVRDRDGIPVAVHRTFLGPVEPRKMSLGPVAGGAVRLAPLGPVLGLAEGIETALSAMELTGIPVWSALSTSGMVAIVVPAGVERMIIFGDDDPPGRAAANNLKCQLSIPVEVRFPEHAKDFNDELTWRSAKSGVLDPS